MRTVYENARDKEASGALLAGKQRKVIVIDRCDDCPWFDNDYHEFAQKCSRLKRVIRSAPDSYPSLYPIPDDCPLANGEGMTSWYVSPENTPEPEPST